MSGIEHSHPGQRSPGRPPQSPGGPSGKKRATAESHLSPYLLPQEAASLVQQALGSSKVCPNLGLQLHRYIPSAVLQLSPDSDSKASPAARQQWLQALAQGYQPDQALATGAYQRWQAFTRALNALHFEAEIDWRMVVGLGGNSVLETDLTLHRNYSLPIVPGSALKGLTRNYATQEDWEVTIPDEQGQPRQRKKAEADLNRLFGTLDQAGSVIFFDAMPLKGEARLELDVMTPHYPDYYQGGKPPSNDQQPVPITFLTVAKTTFAFAIAPRTPTPGDRADTALALALLKQALADYGIGGKTSAGYGYFHQVTNMPPPNGADPADPQEEKGEGLEEARAKARELAALTPEQLQRKGGQELLGALAQMPSPAAQRLLAREIEKIHRQKGVDLQKKSALFNYIKQLLQ
ncbi:MAG: type III-B CRISPR module RAMP protein Cmr6 [Thermogemmatispora sp.]|jgi:CRISPR type III-B/RAMP module RAMP protein Cmr6|uniref:type III-B CRISPR module RAMP protein Cmr6 n=1 Tax=Thermogemmatispora sp. TaxID=1968838 RepID=UPI001A003D6D|nr:type III-B CRISPR module RAMP protein Cmr6 [Thermogemmatispora sp.]MBE3568259.1 type III-B CRISPR module RAMP protein Cmr6 [Thermogemmatispora sp.]